MKRSACGWVIALAVATGCMQVPAALAQCTGDCDEDGMVGISELITAVNIALGAADVGECGAVDANGDGEVTVNELVAAVVAALGECDDDVDLSVVSFVQSVGVIDLGAAGIVRDGAPPPPAGGPSISAPQSRMVINGGGSEARVSSATPFQRVFLSVEVPAGSSAAGLATTPVPGYFDVELPEPVTEADLQITIAPEVQTIAPEFRWLFQVADPEGSVGEPAITEVGVVEVGSGDLQISVSWDSDADVDLHVVEPSGEEIYFVETVSETGGMLDLDALCFSDVRNENITWEGSRAPSGHYIVRLAYFSSCGVDETNYVVTVRRLGQEPETFSGTFTGPGTREAEGGGILITEFDF